jgi:hypothetical protein
MPDDVTIDFGPLNRAFLSVKESNSPFWDKIRKQWFARYLGFIKERFDRYSKGEGNWTALAESTIRGRRKGTKKTRNRGAQSLMRTKGGGLSNAGGRFAILVDTGTLKAAINPDLKSPPGGLREAIEYGIKVGYGSDSHPESKQSIDAIASYHQQGNSRLPRREIIVSPTDAIMQSMANDALRALDSELK